MRHTFRVSTKIALFTPGKTHVAVIWIAPVQTYGLPGGHIEEGEHPDNTIVRELYEECGLTDITTTRADFFAMPDGRVILAYTATLDEHVQLEAQQEVYEGDPKWLTRKEFDAIEIDENYRRLVLRHWEQ